MRTLLADCGGLGDGLHSNKNITEHNSVSTLQKKPKSAGTLEVQRTLWEAARQGNTQLVKSALYDGADVMKPNPADGWLALHYAVSNNRRLTCKFLLSLPYAIQQCTYCNKIGESPIKLCTDGFLKNILQNISDQ
jgi:ankyrin repeat protein